MITKNQRHAVVRCSCSLDTSIYTCVCKVTANIVTYPIETYRLLKQTKQIELVRPLTIKKLYAGLNVFLPYNITNNIINNTCYFVCLDNFARCILKEHAIILACILTSIITCVYKAHLLSLIKKISIHKQATRTTSPFIKKFSILLAEEIPEAILKFYMNHMLHTWLPYWPEQAICVLIGIITALALIPIDTHKTKILCDSQHSITTPQVIILKVIVNTLNISLFLYLFNLNPNIRSSWSTSNA